MNSYQEIVESYRRLQEKLEKLLQGKETNFIAPSNVSLLVLETSSDVVGFTVLQDNSEVAYNSAYTTFKQLYRDKHSVWKERNLSFVACFLETEKNEKALMNLIEMDIYFCRKYVIRFSADEEKLERELLRLPFLPLMEDKIGGIVRPPDAQTLLQSIGISTSLSRQLIVPGERSAGRIIDDVINPSQILSYIGGKIAPRALQELKMTERTRMKSVIVEAFRAYKKKQEFDVDADIVILYGSNGLGKTSFFDAIDYACTGRIGRLCRRNMSQERFIDLARHLSISGDEGSVTLNLSQGTSNLPVFRKVSDWSTAFVGDDKLDRASTLQLLTSARWGEKKERIENLERLFRATHLFSQTDPELLINFDKESMLSTELVSRMLALEDYALGNSKLQEILSILDKRMTSEKIIFDNLEVQHKDVQDQIKELPNALESVQAGQQLKKMAAALVQKMHTYAGVTVEYTTVTVDTVREWRAVIDAEFSNSQEQFSELQKLESGFTQFEKNIKSQKEKSYMLAKLLFDLQKYDAERKRLEEHKNNLIEGLNHSKTDLSRAKRKSEAFTELKSLKYIEQEKQASLQQWIQELSRIEKETMESTIKMQKLLSTMEQIETRKGEAHEALIINSHRINSLTKIKEGFEIWELTKREVSELKQCITVTQSYIEKNRDSINDQQRLINARMGELAEYEQQYKKFTSNQAELTRLLDEIEAYVRDGVCPTCGIDHKNKEKLIERIHAQKENRPTHVEELAVKCRELSKSIEEIEASIALLKLDQESKTKESEGIFAKLVAKQKSVTEFERLLEESELSVNDLELCKIVSNLLDNEINAQQVYLNNFEKAKAEENNLSWQIKELKGKQSQEDACKQTNDAIESLKQQIYALRSKAEVQDMSLEMTFDVITSEQNIWSARKVEAEQQAMTLASQEESLINDIGKIEVSINDLKVIVEKVKEEKEALEREVVLYENIATGIINRDALDLDGIIKQRKLATENIEAFKNLTLQALTLERALDSLQRSAMLSELVTKEQAIIMQKKEAEKKIKRIDEVKKWFLEISTMLNKQSSNAVGDHVRAFGPLTTLLQKRLRAVYGFGDVKLSPISNEIRVEVDWNGKSVKPTDYFSDAQKQILMLSLFMSERLSQTWSGFSPILLDDPVTHFDDLNAFGFVELIRGLVSTSPGKWQFFISTCEDRLFELMQQKFGKTTNAKFYRFEGITDDGPIIKQITH